MTPEGQAFPGLWLVNHSFLQATNDCGALALVSPSVSSLEHSGSYPNLFLKLQLSSLLTHCINQDAKH